MAIPERDRGSFLQAKVKDQLASGRRPQYIILPPYLSNES